MHMFEYQYLVELSNKPNDTHMHYLKVIYIKIRKQVKISLKEQLIFGDHIHKYPNPP